MHSTKKLNLEYLHICDSVNLARDPKVASAADSAIPYHCHPSDS